ncbi:YybH family protein [Pseudaminobacter soli (ex Li et al. 2025)]|uniref:YybH family protein n=1 Tax=Pseudaminobacter soli (ex Li et al. 2025) TaxID=1295366 RepID=UPI0024753C48|nr:nuclear transport factor 2 family protein [Mesorhizobium soli]
MTTLLSWQLLSAPAFAAAGSDEQAIRDQLDNWTKTFNEGRADEVCDLFTDDVIATVRTTPNAGKGEICKRLRNALAKTDRKLAYATNIHEILVSGDLAVVRLTWTLTTEMGGKASMTTDEGMDVFQRGADGVWRIHRYLAFAADMDH